MLADYLQRGVLAGVVAGLAYGLYVAFVANPLTEYVHDAGHDHAGHSHDHAAGGHGHGHAQEGAEHVVSETTTALVSVGSGVLWAILLGGLFAVALYLFEPALPGRDGLESYVLAGAGFLTVSATPWLVVPPAAPGADHLYGVDARIGIYVGLVVLGAIVSAAAILAYGRTAPRHPALGVLAAAVPIAAVAIVLPLVTPTVVTQPDVAGELVTTYQALAALSQAAIWVLIAGTFNRLRRRAEPAGDTAESGDRLTASP
ncbi:CbtA family protein [Haloterrigena salinisoli]|uniref:CbtA family protein n=1 Tax=Haloterrigena salinisoli TaxID=3132747 RepID=UPI0030CC2EBD